jgi:hypothetical protein
MRSYGKGKQTVVGLQRGATILKKNGLESKLAGLKNEAKKRFPGGSKTRVRKRWIEEQAKKLAKAQQAENGMSDVKEAKSTDEAKPKETKAKRSKSKETKAKRSKSKDTKMKD